MTSLPPDKGKFVSMPASAPLSSLRPKRSIFTLRPFSHTEAPPAEEGAEAVPLAPRGRARWWVAGGVLAVAAVPLLWWAGHGKNKPHARAPIVLVNGTPQTKQTAQGSVERWGAGEVTVAIDQSLDSLGPGARAAVQTAFGAWVASGAKLPALRFDTTSGKAPKLEPDGVSSVMLAPIDLPGHKKDLAITISFADPSTGRIVESDVVINAKKPFALLDTPPAAQPGEDDGEQNEAGEAPGCKGWYDLQAVATHEAGHFFGLDEDPEDTAATMFYKTGKCELRKRDLEVPDRTVMASLYEGEPPAGSADAATDTGAGCGGASIVGHAPARNAATLVLAAIAALGLAARRRRTGDDADRVRERGD